MSYITSEISRTSLGKTTITDLIAGLVPAPVTISY